MLFRSVEGDQTAELVPLPVNDGIQALKDKLHARMAALRRGGGRPHEGANGEANSRDELLEERRQQRAAMRERRRKETKEKIRREAEEKGKKAKGKEREKGAQIKVCVHSVSAASTSLIAADERPNCWFPTVERQVRKQSLDLDTQMWHIL